ncbi:MAG TPA: hypothetical protein DD727_01335 [Clostridiales bacterium]|nr:hypothetical protein [Clostridiales bacterium]
MRNRKLIFLQRVSTILLIIILAAVPLTAVQAAPQDTAAVYVPTSYEQAAMDKMELVAENETLQLYYANTNTGIAVRDKRSGKLWFSVPPNIEQDKVAQSSAKARMQSPFTVTYYDPNGQKKTMDAFNDAIKKEQVETSRIPNGIRIVYSLGSRTRGIEDIPKKILADRMEEKFFSKISEEDKEFLLTRYVYIEEDKMYSLQASNIPKEVINQILQIMDQVGYTEADLKKDHRLTGVPPADQDKVYFVIPLEFSLDGERLTARVPVPELQFSPKYPLYMMTMLEFFGAAYGTEIPGYMFLPDGSGTILDFKVPPKLNDQFYANIYGLDQTIHVMENKIVSEQVRMPVFGLKQGEYGFFAIIEDGDSLGRLVATKVSRLHSFNCVYPEFLVDAMDYIRLGDGNVGTSVPAFQTRLYDGDLKVQYYFLNGENANYNGMAATYRNYVMARYGMKKITPEKNIPFILDTVGTVRKEKSFLGIFYRGLEPLTTYKQSGEMAQRLIQAGADNVALRLTAWFNGGFRQEFAVRQKYPRVLGGAGDLKDLVQTAKESGFEIYPGVILLTTPQESAGFNKFTYSAKRADARTARAANFDTITWARTFSRPIISNAKLSKVVEKYIKGTEKYDFGGVALTDIGVELYSDFNKAYQAERQSGLKIQGEVVRTFAEKVGPVMVSGGSMVSIPYASMAIQTPIDDSRYFISDYSIPFYQMVFHGLVEYAAYPVNLSQTMDRDKLRMIQTGCAVYYQWMSAPSKMVKETYVDHLYSINIDDWFEDAMGYYKQANEALKDVQDKFMVRHAVLATDVEEVEYEDGTRLIFNYGKTPYISGDITVPAQNFIKLKGR